MTRLTLWMLCLALFASSAAYGDSLIGVNWYSYYNDHRHLVVIDPVTGALLGGHEITLAGSIVEQPTALAADPTNGILYALLTLADWSGAELVTLDPVTGVATSVGNTGQRIRSLTFRPDGTLLGIASPYDPSSTPVTLFTIDKATAVASPVCDPTGADDYVIAYDANISQLYYATGTDAAKVFQTLDQSSCVPTNIGYTGGGGGAVTALFYDEIDDAFLAADGGVLASITPAGVVSPKGPLAFADDASATIRGFARTTAEFAFGDVAIFGSFDPDTIPPGGPTTLTMNVVNNGSTPLTGVEGRVSMHAARLTFEGASGDAECVQEGLLLVCSFGDLAAGATETVYVDFTADIASDSPRADIQIWARANEYDTHPNDNNDRISIYRGEEGCTGGFLLTSELLSGDPSPAPGYSGSWTFRITATNCTGAALEAIRIQGGTNGWGDYVSRVASRGTTSMKVNRRAEVITWRVDLGHGDEATLDVTMSGAISAGHVCSPDILSPVFGSVKYLNGIWSAVHPDIGDVATGPVSIVVECP